MNNDEFRLPVKISPEKANDVKGGDFFNLTFEGLPRSWEGPFDLVGQDGNVFALLGYVSRCIRDTSFDSAFKRWMKEKMVHDVTTGDSYDNSLRVLMDFINVCNANYLENNPDWQDEWEQVTTWQRR